MRYLFLMLIITVLILGYGYWHVSTHATLNISLYDFSVEKSFILLKEANIILREGNGKVLATGQSDARYGTVYLAHPETGSCYEAEHKATRSRDAMNTWQICFKQNSTWIMKWIGKVRFADVQVKGCGLDNIPVSVKEHRADWWMWWVPLPHVGGKPYTYFSLTLHIDPINCRAVD